jgi:hypothetical protein
MPQPVDRHLADNGDCGRVEEFGDVLAHERRANENTAILINHDFRVTRVPVCVK